MAEPEGGARRIGPATVAGVLAVYLAALVAATFPYARSLTTDLPCAGDPPQHLWIMGWYRSCLREGRSPLFCPELHHPVGVPLGNFSPLLLQTALFLPLSAATGNDVLSYNMIWIVGLLTTGLGTFLLAWHVVRDRTAAALAGLLAMLSGPVMLHAHAHLELTFVGTFPLFLLSWVRLLDAPGRGRLLAAAGAFLLMTASAAYFVVLAAPAAACAVAWPAAREGRRGMAAWVRARAGWLAAFGALVAPGLMGLFASQLWAVAHGQPMARSRGEFVDHGAPLWGYFTPTYLHILTRWTGLDAFDAAGYRGLRVGLVHDNGSYLGLVTLGLVVYAAVGRVRFPRAGLWWATLGLLVLLSMGAYAWAGPRRVSLPALWLYRNTVAFRLIRSPARFNLFAAVVAAVVASAGLARLLGGCRSAWARAAIAGALAIVAVVDLAMVPYRSWRIAPPPACYAAVRARDPDATLLELPLQSSSFDTTLLDRTYWQSRHRLKTSAGYSGVTNVNYDGMICVNTPFPTWRPDFLARPGPEAFGIVNGADFDAYAWLFLTAHDYSHILIHRSDTIGAGDPAVLSRVEARLAGAKVFDDGATAVFERSRLATPARPAVVCTRGWRPSMGMPGPLVFGASRSSVLAVFQPESEGELTLYLAASALRKVRLVRLISKGDELARWRVETGTPGIYTSPPLRLGRGVHELSIVADGEDRPRSMREAVDEARSAYSLRVTGLSLQAAPGAVAAGDGQRARE